MLLRVGAAVVGTRRCCLWLLSLTYQTSNLSDSLVELGCPRNNQIFFRFRPKQTKTQSVLVVFRFVSQNQKTFFSVCFGFSDRYQNNRNKQNFVETNRKNLQKLFSNVFRIAFSRNQKNFFSRFVSMFRTSIETNRTYGLGN